LELNMARETANEDIDRAVQQARAAVEEVFGSGNFANSEGGTQVLVELLLARGAQDDLAEAEAAIERLAGALPGSEWVTRDISLLRLRALLAQTHGDEAAYRDYRNRYRAMANDLGFEGHMAWAAAMP
jgi:adenylate cyclase